MKQQLNIRIEDDLVRDLKVEAAQMGIGISVYIELLLSKRKELLK